MSTVMVALALLAAPVLVTSNVRGQDLIWAQQLGGTMADLAAGVALDASGNAYTVGQFQGTADFNPGPGTFHLTSAGSNDVFISKVDSAGNYVWARQLGGTTTDSAQGVVLDESGNVYTVGFFTGTADFDPGPGTFNLTSAGSDDAFVSKLDSAGNFVWAKRLGGTGSNKAEGVALDASGNVYSVGFFQGTGDFDPGPGTFNLTSGSSDAFISKLDSSGNFVWAKQLGATAPGIILPGSSVALDANGNVYTVGAFRTTADFDPGPGTFNMTPAAWDDAFVSKLDSAGTFVWAKRLGGTGMFDLARGVALDAGANVYTVGYFEGTADFDPGPGTFNLTSAAGNGDAFISKLDSAGNFVWAKQLGGTASDSAQAVAVSANGAVYTVGYFLGTADFDPGPDPFNLTSAGSNDAFISKLDSAGNFVWARQLGGTMADQAEGVALSASASVYVVGYFQGTADFDPGPGTFSLTSAGGNDAFVCKLRGSSFPGRVPPSVRLDRIAPTVVRLTWEASTCAGASDYAIYEGLIGSWYSHAAADCHDDGGNLVEELTTSADDTYYLVVPHNVEAVGSYGLRTGGIERSPAVVACAPVQQLGCP